MSKTRGEGRAPAEKQGRLVGGKTRKERREERDREEREWAEKSGPVTTRNEPVQPSAVLSARDPRAVLLKPGDLLVIGNVGSISPEHVQALHHGLEEIKDALGISGVVIFESDVSISSIEERVFQQFRESSREA